MPSESLLSPATGVVGVWSSQKAPQIICWSRCNRISRNKCLLLEEYAFKFHGNLYFLWGWVTLLAPVLTAEVKHLCCRVGGRWVIINMEQI